MNKHEFFQQFNLARRRFMPLAQPLPVGFMGAIRVLC